MEVFIMWKKIKGYDNYKINQNGDILNKKGHKLSPAKNGAGYLFVLLCKDGYCKPEAIHRLVAIHFVENKENKPVVHHIDENKTNNNYLNLKWCTQKENLNFGTGLARMGIAHKKPIIMIDVLGKKTKYSSAADCEQQTGIKRGYINQVLKGRYKSTSGGYRFEYQNRV